MPESSSDIPSPNHSAADAPMIGAQIRRPGLTLVATPIGNLADLSARAVATLRHAELILCEDTRVTARLCAAHDIATRLAPLHDHNEDARTPALLARLQQGAEIALVSDAGTPLVSDPGYRLVRAVIAAGLPLHGVPGPNAALMALTLSGLPPPSVPVSRLRPHPRRPRRQLPGPPPGRTRRPVRHPHLARSPPTASPKPSPTSPPASATAQPPSPGNSPSTTRKSAATPSPHSPPHYADHEARGEIVLLVGPAPDETTDVNSLDDMLRNALTHMTLKDAAAAVAPRHRPAPQSNLRPRPRAQGLKESRGKVRGFAPEPPLGSGDPRPHEFGGHTPDPWCALQFMGSGVP